MKPEVKVDGKRLQITRFLDAPRRVVFAWWADAEKLQQWSGCKDATKCEIKMDFRVGGSFTQKMQLGDKGEFALTGTYDEIIVPERISYHLAIGRAITHVLVEFFEDGDQTKVVLTHEGFPDDFTCSMVSQGTTESLDRLGSTIADREAVRLL